MILVFKIFKNLLSLTFIYLNSGALLIYILQKYVWKLQKNSEIKFFLNLKQNLNKWPVYVVIHKF